MLTYVIMLLDECGHIHANFNFVNFSATILVYELVIHYSRKPPWITWVRKYETNMMPLR